MNILYIITQAETGGAQKYVATLAMAAKSRNWSVNVAFGEPGDNWLINEIKVINGKICRLKHLKRAISPLNDILTIFELAKLYQNIKPDIIHLNSSKSGVLGSLATIIYKPKNCKIIYTAHGWVFNEPMPKIKKQLYYWLERMTAINKDKIICVSEFDRQTAIQNKVAPKNKLITINIGIDLPKNYFLSKNESKKILIGDSSDNESRIIIGTIANFYPTKGLNYLLDTFAILIRELPLPLSLIIIGDGELRPELEFKIKNLKLEKNIILTGRLNRGSKYLKAFDIFVLASIKEGFPYCLLEAMSAELPIVTTNVGGIPEINNDGQTGLLSPPQNPNNLATNIKTLIKNNELRLLMGQNGYTKIKNEFNQDKMIKKTFETYLD